MIIISVEKIADRMAQGIAHHYPESSSVAVLKYGLIALINQIIVWCCVLIFGAITGRMTDTIVAMVVFPILRYISGGAHLKGPGWCNVMTVSILFLAIYIPVQFWYNGVVINTIAALILAVTAPSGIERSRLDKKHYPILKVIALAIVCSNYLLESPVLSLLFFFQSLTTLRIFYRILRLKNEVRS